jgi:hypothetical protein
LFLVVKVQGVKNAPPWKKSWLEHCITFKICMFLKNNHPTCIRSRRPQHGKMNVHEISTLRPRLFYLLDYGFLPQNVSEVGGQKKKKLRDPKVQIITVGHYCNLKMVVSRAQLLFVWSPCTTVYRFDGRFKHLASARVRFQ